MPRRTFTDEVALASLLARAERVVTHAELKALGVPASTIVKRMRRGGPWQSALPGVVIAHRGTPTERERLLAAQRYGGESAVVTGLPALRLRGVRAARTPADRAHILIPHTSQRTSHSFVVVERTRRLPEATDMHGLRVAPIARAVIDAGRRLKNLDLIRELVAEVVQDRRCTPAELLIEAQAAARQRMALTREALSEVTAGVRSVAEARIKQILQRGGIPAPLWNVDLFGPGGEFLGRPDAYWPSVGAALEIDSMAFHLTPAAYKRTQRRQRRLTVHGILVCPVAPGDALSDPDAFLAEVKGLLAAAASRPCPAVYVRPRAA